MKSTIQTAASPERVWAAFRKAYDLNGETPKRIKYRILSVEEEGSSFKMDVQWNTFFVYLIFTHAVAPHKKGSEVAYSVEIRGVLAPFVRFFLRKRIQRTLEIVLCELAQKLA